MPYHCRHITCQELIPTPGYCDVHRPAEEFRRHSYFARHKANPEAQRFYSSAGWRRCRADVLANFPTCQRCKNSWAEHVHHIVPFERCTPEQRYDRDNLKALCQPCHNIVTAQETEPEVVPPYVWGMLSLKDDDTYYYDATAGERPIKFVEKFVRYVSGPKAGDPFELAPVQKQILRDVYGYLNRTTGKRRFQRVYWNGSVGCGKSPILAIVALFELFFPSEHGNQIYCMASTYSQANKTIFDLAKRMVRANAELESRCKIRQYYIQNNKDLTTWHIISGSGKQAGLAPGLIVADECHQWKSDEAFNELYVRRNKRQQPLAWIATNTATHRNGAYGSMQQEAEEVLTGTRTDPSLYPILWQAGPDDAIDEIETWRKANPLIGVTVTESALQAEWSTRKGLPEKEREWRQLYLGQYVTGSTKWIDLEQWDKVTNSTLPDTSQMPLYVGLDMSAGDDICGVAMVSQSPDELIVECKAWLPKVTSERYEKSEGHPYYKWGIDGHIELLNEITITPDVHKRIADFIIARHQRQPITALAYDKKYANLVVHYCEQAGITCIPVPQGFGVSPGCVELERRLTEGSIAITDNPVLRNHAENAEVKTGELRGDIYPVKPGHKATAHGGSKGRRGIKIDLITALVTAITEIQRRIAPPKPKEWSGVACVV